MFFRKKKIEIRPEEPKQELEAIELWEVRWYSRYGEYSGDVKPEMEVFTSEKDAVDFKKALYDAFKLLKHTSGTDISIKRKE